MQKSLVIAEKPSVAQDIARVLGDAKRHGDYFESPRYLVTSAIGHLIEIYNPEEEDAQGKRMRGEKNERLPGKWTFDSLPVLPGEFSLRPTKDGADRLKVIKKLAKRDDVDCVINACDAGREGELIFHFIASLLDFKQPTKRMWLQSMTANAILEGLASLRGSNELLPLRNAAVARSEADWLVGINATRSLTALNSKDGGFMLTTVGRVQTPTLALLVAREEQRRAHKSRPYWMLDVTFSVASGDYVSTWHKKEKRADDPEDKINRIWDADMATDLHAKFSSPDAPSGTARDTSKERKINPPLLFNLNDLQREANKLYSFSARQTLSVAQRLYERYKLLTYPRTESRHLPPDYIDNSEETIAKFARGTPSGPLGDYLDMASLATPATKAKGKVKLAAKRVFDMSKVSDHFAIIPTGQLPKDNLPPAEQRVYDLVCRRFIGAFLPAARVLETTRETQVAGETFSTHGRVVQEQGWMVTARNELKDKNLPALAGDSEEARATGESELHEKATQPPPRYNDATLLSAMRRAADFVEQEELSEALQAGGGLGTPATRASIIEELLRNEYLIRDGTELIPTARSFSLLEILTDMEVSELTKPDLTAEWENRLREIEDGSGNAQKFLEDIREMVSKVVAVAKVHDPDATEGDYVTLKQPCPKCGGKVEEGYRKYSCSDCGFFIWKTVASRQLSPQDAQTLLRDGKAGPIVDFKSKRGATFAATLVLGENGKIDMEFEQDKPEEVDLTTAAKVGKCPKCAADVFETPTRYSCVQYIDGSGNCDFKLPRSICQRQLEIEEAAMLLDPQSARTQLLTGFISKRGRPFKSYLTLSKDGKMAFEFEERKKPAAKKGAASKAKKAAKPKKAAVSKAKKTA